jgi:hypothetical protein
MRILSLDAFTRAHFDLEGQLRRYALTSRGRKVLIGNVLDNLMRRSASSLKATNPRARMAVAEAAEAILGPVIDGQDSLFFVTLAPRQFGRRLEQARSFDFQELRDWALEQLHGCHHIGAIEGAYYSNYLRGPLKQNQEPWVSFHTHHLCWNVDEAKIRATVGRLNENYPAFLTGLDSAHYRAWKSVGARSRIFYMLKAPLEEYCVVHEKQAGQNPLQKKRKLRPGDAVRMLSAMRRCGFPLLSSLIVPTNGSTSCAMLWSFTVN